MCILVTFQPTFWVIITHAQIEIGEYTKQIDRRRFLNRWSPATGVEKFDFLGGEWYDKSRILDRWSPATGLEKFNLIGGEW